MHRHCEAVLRTAEELGMSEAEAVYSKKRTTTVRIAYSEIAEIKESEAEAVSARLVSDKTIFAARVSDLNRIPQDIKDGLFRARKSLRPSKFWGELPSGTNRYSVPETFDPKLDGISGKDSVDIAQSMINESLNGRITSVSGSLNIVSDYFEVANSRGLEFGGPGTFVSGMISADSESGTVPASGIGHRCGRTLGGFDAEAVGREAREMCLSSINPTRAEDGTCSVILGPYSVGEILTFVLAPNFGLRAVSEAKSCFSDMRGQEVAPESLSIHDDPFVPDAIGSKPVDDEGVPAKRLSLIDGGVFENTFSDLYDSFEFGCQSSGNARRPGLPMGTGAEPETVAAPHNISVEGRDTCSVEDLAKDVKKGIMIGRLWYTYAVNPIRGDFSCTARSGIQIVENGRIRGPGKQVRIVGNIKSLLANTAGIADDARNVQQWGTPSSSIAPTMRFDGVRVGPL